MWRFLSVSFAVLMAAGCVTRNLSYEPTSVYSESDLRSITDEDIRKAFEARPQIKLPARIAWYDMGTGDLMTLLMAKAHPNVSGPYEIPKALVEGARPYFAPRHYDPHYYSAPQQINLKALRLLAARARCDVLILVGSRFEEQRDINAWGALNILIVPIFLAPFQHARYHYEAEAFIFDVRNGYLYKHAKSISDEERRYLTIYSVEDRAKSVHDEVKEKGRQHLLREIYSLFETE
jgi:hypothetical protein